MAMVQMMSSLFMVIFLACCFMEVSSQDAAASKSKGPKLPFDCRRPSQGCHNGSCIEDANDPKAYKCQCEEGFSGHTCCIAQSEEKKSCEECERGECISGVCVCEEDAFGPKCKQDRVQVMCTATGITILVAPSFSKMDPYLGHLVIMGHNESEGCDVPWNKMKAGENGKMENSYFKETFNFSDCGVAMKEMDEDGKPIANSFDVEVSYTSDIIVMNDFPFTAICEWNEGGEMILEQGIVTSKRLLSEEDRLEVRDEYTPDEVKMKFEDESGKVLAGPLAIGEEFVVSFTEQGKGGFRIVNMQACNGDEDEEDCIDLIKDGKKVEDNGVTFYVECEGDIVKVTIQAFMYTGSTKLYIRAKVKPCASPKCQNEEIPDICKPRMSESSEGQEENENEEKANEGKEKSGEENEGNNNEEGNEGEEEEGTEQENGEGEENEGGENGKKGKKNEVENEEEEEGNEEDENENDEEEKEGDGGEGNGEEGNKNNGEEGEDKKVKGTTTPQPNEEEGVETDQTEGEKEENPANGVDTASRRKRRGVRSSEAYQEINDFIDIRLPNRHGSEDRHLSKTQVLAAPQNPCNQSVTLIILVGVLAVLLIITMGAALVLYIQLRTRSFKQIGCVHNSPSDDMGKIDYRHFSL